MKALYWKTRPLRRTASGGRRPHWPGVALNFSLVFGLVALALGGLVLAGLDGNFAELLGLRAPGELGDLFQAAGLRVVGKRETRPVHHKVSDTSDPLHAARAAEVTSLWRLQVGAAHRGRSLPPSPW